MNFNKPTLVSITAPTASGKSYLLNEIDRRGLFTRVVSTTTRQPRSGEQEGVDYYYISEEESIRLEQAGELFELNMFGKYRYGVTKAEMARCFATGKAPVVILEPNGVEMSKHRCVENGWDMFKIYVHVTESVRIERLEQRHQRDMAAGLVAPEVLREAYQHRLHVVHDERRWSNTNIWDAIVPGDDVEKAISMIQDGIVWRNKRNAV